MLSQKTNFPLYTVDAFTKHPFKGNSAAVCLLMDNELIKNDVKQKIALEMNLSETAFVSVAGVDKTFENAKRFKLQWFTPLCEVTLCGHATLASAAVLYSLTDNMAETLEFETPSGVLKATKLGNGLIKLDLPAYKSKLILNDKYNNVVKATVGSLPVQKVSLSDSGKLLIQLADEVSRQQLGQIKPQAADLLSAASDLKGVIVTCLGSDKDEDGKPYDFISRYFAPWLGILEDPVTGSAHAVLAPYWAKILKKNNLYAHQCSARGGDLHLEVELDRVAVCGHAVIVVRGNITV